MGNPNPSWLAVRVGAFFGLAPLVASAQAPQFLWIEQAGNSGTIEGNGLALDSSRNIYVVGSMTGTATFGGTTLSSFGANSDVIIAKFDPFGRCSWASQFGGPNIDRGTAIAVDAFGNSFITGSFAGSATFGSITLSSSTPGYIDEDAFMAKIDGLGGVAWATRGGGYVTGPDDDAGKSVAVDTAGNGHFAGATAGGQFEGNYIRSGTYFMKYSSTGLPQWAKAAGNGVPSPPSGPVVGLGADGSIFLVGTFVGTGTWGNLYAQTNLTSSSVSGFVAKYTPTGALIWVGQLGSGAQMGVAPTTSGGVYVLTQEGSFTKLYRFAANGSVQWSQTVSNGTTKAICADSSDNLLATGTFKGTVNLGGTNLSGASVGDIFLVKYSPDGSLLWAMAAGSVPRGTPRSVAVDNAGGVYIAGSFSATARLGLFTLTSGADTDLFVARLGTGTNMPQPSLGLDMYPGLSITGIVGRLYLVEYSEAVQTNWLPLARIVLPASPHLWFDTSANRGPKRFYRASIVQP